MSSYCPNEFGLLHRALLRHPRLAWESQRRLSAEWRNLHYPAEPDFVRACAQYDQLVSLLEATGVGIEWLDGGAGGPDSVYTHDPAVVGPRGAVLGWMGKPIRGAEPHLMEAAFERCGIPILGRIEAPGHLEGGDVVWLDRHSVAVGEGYRTSAEGIRQLAVLLAEPGLELIPVPLPHWRGPTDCLHLMSILSPVDDDLAVVYSPLMSVPFRRLLQHRGIHLVEVPDDEWASMGCNVLAVAPRRCIMLEGNPRTRGLLERAGAEVRVFDGSEISLKGCGGPTCLARPLRRT